MAIEQILQAVAVTAELTGASLSPAAQAMMVKDLSCYPEAQTLKAFDRFRREAKGRLTLAGIISLIEEEDGRPSADEAWAMCPRNEEDSTFWNDEIQAAMGIARPVLDSGDKIGARMAFRDAYERLVREARSQNRNPNWSLSLGWDKAGRVESVAKAVAAGLLTQDQALPLLPAPASPLVSLIEGNPRALLADASQDDRATLERGVALIRETLDSLDRKAAERRAEEERREAERRAQIEANRADQLRRAAEKMAKDAGNMRDEAA